jgi:hypothetical protein
MMQRRYIAMMLHSYDAMMPFWVIRSFKERDMDKTSGQEMALHIALCVCADYVEHWGLAELLYRLEEYSGFPTIPAVAHQAEHLEELLQ